MSDTVIVRGQSRTVVVTDPKAALRVSKDGSQVATRSHINFIEGANVTLTATNNTESGRIDVTIAAGTGGTGGGRW